MSFPRLYFNLIWLLCPTKPVMTDSPKLTFDPACDAISSVQIKFCNIFGKVKPGAIKCRFRIKNRSSSLTDSKGRGETDPHRRSWSGNTPSGRELKRLSRSFQTLFFVYFFIASTFQNCFTMNDIEFFLSLLIYKTMISAQKYHVLRCNDDVISIFRDIYIYIYIYIYKMNIIVKEREYPNQLQNALYEVKWFGIIIP